MARGPACPFAAGMGQHGHGSVRLSSTRACDGSLLWEQAVGAASVAPCSVGSSSLPSRSQHADRRVRSPRRAMIRLISPTSRRQPITCLRRSLLLRRGISPGLPVCATRAPNMCHPPPGLRCLPGSWRFLLRVRAAAGSIAIGMASIAPMRSTSVHTWASSGEGPGGAWPRRPHAPQARARRMHPVVAIASPDARLSPSLPSVLRWWTRSPQVTSCGLAYPC